MQGGLSMLVDQPYEEFTISELAAMTDATQTRLGGGPVALGTRGSDDAL